MFLCVLEAEIFKQIHMTTKMSLIGETAAAAPFNSAATQQENFKKLYFAF